MQNSFPILEFDEGDSMISPFQTQELLRDLNGTDTCVMTFFPNLDNHPISKKFDKLYTFSASATYVPQYLYKDSLVVANVPMGGPAASVLMEQLISMGITRFIACGSAGLLRQNFDPEKLLLVKSAIRDEGTSYQYIPADETAITDALLTAQYAEALKKRGIEFEYGTIWSTDAIFRETHTRVVRRENAGAIGVDMQCASLCAVAARRGVSFAMAAYFSDFLSSDVWSGYTKNYDDQRLKSLELLLSVGMEIAQDL